MNTRSHDGASGDPPMLQIRSEELLLEAATYGKIVVSADEPRKRQRIDQVFRAKAVFRPESPAKVFESAVYAERDQIGTLCVFYAPK